MPSEFNPAMLRLARHSREMSQAELASEARIWSRAIGRYEHGKSIPAPEVLERLAEALHYPVSFSYEEPVPRAGQTFICGLRDSPERLTGMLTDATFSPCGVFRYTLTRLWLTGSGILVFVMLNPSTADALQDDPTVRRVIAYAVRWGYRGVIVLNIFGLRATDPAKLYWAEDPIGPGNEAAFREVLAQHDVRRVVCAWGNHGTHGEQGVRAYRWIVEAGHTPYALNLTKQGMPVHPLYQKSDAEPFPITIHQDGDRFSRAA